MFIRRWWVASARLYRYKRRIPADVPVVDYRPTGFLDPRICVTVRKRGKESRGSVTGTGSLPTRSSSFSFVGERQVLRHLFTLPISSLSLSISPFSPTDLRVEKQRKNYSLFFLSLSFEFENRKIDSYPLEVNCSALSSVSLFSPRNLRVEKSTEREEKWKNRDERKRRVDLFPSFILEASRISERFLEKPHTLRGDLMERRERERGLRKCSPSVQ